MLSSLLKVNNLFQACYYKLANKQRLFSHVDIKYIDGSVYDEGRTAQTFFTFYF